MSFKGSLLRLSGTTTPPGGSHSHPNRFKILGIIAALLIIIALLGSYVLLLQKGTTQDATSSTSSSPAGCGVACQVPEFGLPAAAVAGAGMLAVVLFRLSARRREN